MSANRLYHTWFVRILQLRPDERITRLRNLVWLMVGIYQSRSVHLSAVAAPGGASPGSIARPSTLLIGKHRHYTIGWLENARRAPLPLWSGAAGIFGPPKGGLRPPKGGLRPAKGDLRPPKGGLRPGLTGGAPARAALALGCFAGRSAGVLYCATVPLSRCAVSGGDPSSGRGPSSGGVGDGAAARAQRLWGSRGLLPRSTTEPARALRAR
jgi:hypothetical protein